MGITQLGCTNVSTDHSKTREHLVACIPPSRQGYHPSGTHGKGNIDIGLRLGKSQGNCGLPVVLVVYCRNCDRN